MSRIGNWTVSSTINPEKNSPGLSIDVVSVTVSRIIVFF